MASNLFAGNPPPNVVKWIEDNVKTTGSWNFDITKSIYLGEQTFSASSQSQNLVGGYEMSDGTFAVVTRNWLNARFACVNFISKASDGYHLANASTRVDYDSPSGYARLVAVSDDGMNSYWTNPSTANTLIVQCVNQTPFEFSTAIAKTSPQTISSSGGSENAVLSHDGMHLFWVKYTSIIYRYDLAVPYDISTLGSEPTMQFDTALSYAKINGITLSPDGKKIVVSWVNNNYKYRMTSIIMSDQYDLTTAELNGTLYIDQSIQGVAVSPDGKTLITSPNGSSTAKLYEYSLMANTSDLPDGCRQVAYLERTDSSSNGPYIITDIYGSNDLDFEIEAMCYDYSARTYFGARYSHGIDSYDARIYNLVSGTQYGTDYGRFGFGNHTWYDWPAIKNIRNEKFWAKKIGSTVTSSGGAEFDVSSEPEFTTPYPIEIFAMSTVSQSRHNQEGLLGRIYSLSFSRNGEKIADLIPVVKDDIGYLYDRVTGRLMGSENDGKFTWAELTD